MSSRAVTAYKLLALDLDGTLLRPDGTIDERDRRALAELASAGIPATIVTGRLYSGSIGAARAAGITGPIACVDGSQIVDSTDNRSLFESAIAGENASVLRGIVERHRMASFLFAQDSIVHDHDGARFVPYVQTWSPNISVTERLTAHPFWDHNSGLLALVAVAPASVIAAAVEVLREELSHAAHVVSFALRRFDDLHALVARAAGPTKGTAIEWLAVHHGCTASEVVAVGDWLNDVPMFKKAGRSFVMAQAPDIVKLAATDRLEADVDRGGGVAEAIARAWG